MKIRHGFVSNSSSSSFIASIGVIKNEDDAKFEQRGVVIPISDLIKIRDEVIESWEMDEHNFEWYDTYAYDTMDIKFSWWNGDLKITSEPRYGHLVLSNIISKLPPDADVNDYSIYAFSDQTWNEGMSCDDGFEDTWVREETLVNSPEVVIKDLYVWEGYDG